MGTEDDCLVVVAIPVVVTIVRADDVFVVKVFVVDLVVGSWSRTAEGDGKALRRIAATIRTLTRCAFFICIGHHAHGTASYLLKHIVVQGSFRIVQEDSRTHGQAESGRFQARRREDQAETGVHFRYSLSLLYLSLALASISSLISATRLDGSSMRRLSELLRAVHDGSDIAVMCVPPDVGVQVVQRLSIVLRSGRGNSCDMTQSPG